MKRIISYLLILTVFIFLFNNCEKENIVSPTIEAQAFESQFKIRKVKLSEIPTIRNFLATKNIFSNTKSTEIGGAIFDDDNIMEVIDTLNRTNYSFRFVYPDTPVGTFYNLIVGKTPEGENKTPYVLKYVCDDANLGDFISNNFEFSYFKGQVSVHKYTDFFELASILKIDPNCPPSYDENGDPMPCDTEGVDGGSTGSGGGYGDGETADTGGDTSYNSTGDSNPGPDGSDSSSSGTGDGGSGGSSGSGGGSPCVTSECYPSWDDCQEYIVEINPDCLNNDGQIAPSDDASTSTKVGGDCPECPNPEGGVGVLPNPNSTEDFAETLNELLSDESPYDVDMSTVLDSINLPSPDSTKIANTKLLCLYSKLTSSGNFKNLFTNTFGESKNLNVEFKVTKDLMLDTVRVNGLTTTQSGSFRNNVTGEVFLNLQIEIDEDYLNSGSNFSLVKTILHESIHAYLVVKLLNCHPSVVLNSYDGLQLSDAMFLFYDNACNGTVSQHQLMFDYMIPTFQQVFNEIGITNLASIEDIDRFTNNADLNWQDFFHYLSMQGLHSTQPFIDQIQSDANEVAEFNKYLVESRILNDECN